MDSPTRLPALESERLVIRPFVLDDLAAVHDLLDVQLHDADTGTEGVLSLAGRERWLHWCVLNEEALAYLHQPPYGDRAIVLKATGAIVGSCGYVPGMLPVGQLPSTGGKPNGLFAPELALYYAVAPSL